MKKELTGYILEEISKNIVKIYKNGKVFGSGVMGITSCLEAIFIEEKATKEDWYIVEDNKVFKVNRAEYEAKEIE